ncbi:hypothetical protein PFISCL1PPCAC_19035, partial [Pristionchus fissidentatus]
NLALYSTFFETLFFGGFKESSMEEIEINGVSSEDFTTFLNVLHQFKPVTDDTFDILLELAHRFDCKICMDYVEKFLRRHIYKYSKSSLTRYLFLSERYGLHFLKKEILEEVKSVETLGELMKSEYWNE